MFIVLSEESLEQMIEEGDEAPFLYLGENDSAARYPAVDLIVFARSESDAMETAREHVRTSYCEDWVIRTMVSDITEKIPQAIANDCIGEQDIEPGVAFEGAVKFLVEDDPESVTQAHDFALSTLVGE